MRIQASVIAATIIYLGFTTSCTTNSSNRNKSSGTDTGSVLIPVDSANKMIQSYVNSINTPSTTNDTDVKSFFVDASELRNYLDSTNITQIKIVLAHTLNFINNGHGNQNAGYKSGAFTLVLAGVDKDGKYIYMPGNNVINHSAPCPTNCPPGAAGNDLLTTVLRK